MKPTIFLIALIMMSQAMALTDSALCRKDSFQNEITFSNQNILASRTDEITVVSWNGHKYEDPQHFYDIKSFSESSDILMLQEALHSTGWQAAFASHMSMSFSFYKSFCDFDDQANGVMTAARFPLLSSMTLPSTATEPGSFTHKASGYSALLINGVRVHLINTHALNFNLGADFEQQITQLAYFISQLKGPVIWAGDFNTWSPGRKEFLNRRATDLGLTHLIPRDDPRALILDHIYVRGFTPIFTEVLTMSSSDHYPMRAVLRLNSN